ncbi:hypothetical protein [Cohnella lupini]|uniref:YhfM-like domain-containing protein n=1 Tax=Cohnella lupini TaxID=1294267 RepID=A0A3D9IWY6_9BACL|nr:hypothetical protein [Cohnella lupini]RED66117.1 hypothetical protein DFP95_101615 [Cohnella lupini]
MSVKRKWGVVIALAALIGVSAYFYAFRVMADEVVVYAVTEQGEQVQGSKRVFTDKETVKTFTYAARFANKQPGKVDIAAPDYRFYLNDKKYNLWLSESYRKGTLMKLPNSGTIYTIGEKTANKLKKILGVGK